jgi:hypothetical protein
LSGDLAAAEQSFASACEYGIDALPGLALLRLRQDRLEDARASLDAALGVAAGPLDEARLPPALVEIALAQGDAAAAGDRLSRWRTICGWRLVPTGSRAGS